MRAIHAAVTAVVLMNVVQAQSNNNNEPESGVYLQAVGRDFLLGQLYNMKTDEQIIGL